MTQNHEEFQPHDVGNASKSRMGNAFGLPLPTSSLKLRIRSQVPNPTFDQYLGTMLHRWLQHGAAKTA